MRNFWARDFPVGDPLDGPAFGRRTDPGSVSTGGLAQGAGIFGMLMNFIGGRTAASGNQQAAVAATNAGDAMQAAADFEAAQLRVNAGQAVAGGQRNAQNETLKAQLLASRAAAVAAAGGGAVTDPSVTHIIADITGRGSYNAAVALYQGEDAARSMNAGADAKTLEGKIAKQGGIDRAAAYNTQADAANLRAFGALGTGALSLFGKYGQGGPGASPLAATEDFFV